MDTLLLGVDVGTTGAKAVVATPAGKLVAQHTAEYGFLTPRPLWAEQWPQVWLEGLAAAVRGVLEKSGAAPARVAAMTVSSLYGGSGIPVDDRLEPLRPCLIWLDRRAQAETDWVRQALPLERLFAVTGNGVDSYYGFTKILWIRDHEPDIWRRVRLLLPPNAWLIHRLTGRVAVDHSSAGNIGGVYDIQRRRWSDETTRALGIPLDRLPERLVASSEVVGGLHREGAALLGLPVGTPVCAGGVDAAVATLSAGVFRDGQHVAMMGTSMCWGFIHQQVLREPGFVSMPYVLHPEPTTYTFGGAATAGAVAKWFRDELGRAEQAVERWTVDSAGLTAYGLLDAEAARVLIAGAVVRPANAPEHEALAPLLEDARRHGEVEEVLIDRGYLASTHIGTLRRQGIAIRAKPWPSRNAGRFTKEDFTIRIEQKEITCPAKERVTIRRLGSVVHFPASACDPCSLRSRCTVATSGRGRSIAIHEQEDLFVELRGLKRTPEGRAALRERTAIEHRLARLYAVQGPRARYKGARKNTLDVRRCAAVNNLQVLQRAA